VVADSTLYSRDESLNTDSPAQVSSSMCLDLIALYILQMFALNTIRSHDPTPLVGSSKRGPVRVGAYTGVCVGTGAGVCVGVCAGGE
jgi:hypothetical protein